MNWTMHNGLHSNAEFLCINSKETTLSPYPFAHSDYLFSSTAQSVPSYLSAFTLSMRLFHYPLLSCCCPSPLLIRLHISYPFPIRPRTSTSYLSFYPFAHRLSITLIHYPSTFSLSNRPLIIHSPHRLSITRIHLSRPSVIHPSLAYLCSFPLVYSLSIIVPCPSFCAQLSPAIICLRCPSTINHYPSSLAHSIIIHRFLAVHSYPFAKRLFIFLPSSLGVPFFLCFLLIFRLLYPFFTGLM